MTKISCHSFDFPYDIEQLIQFFDSLSVQPGDEIYFEAGGAFSLNGTKSLLSFNNIYGVYTTVGAYDPNDVYNLDQDYLDWVYFTYTAPAQVPAINIVDSDSLDIHNLKFLHDQVGPSAVDGIYIENTYTDDTCLWDIYFTYCEVHGPFRYGWYVAPSTDISLCALDTFSLNFALTRGTRLGGILLDGHKTTDTTNAYEYFEYRNVRISNGYFADTGDSSITSTTGTCLAIYSSTYLSVYNGVVSNCGMNNVNPVGPDGIFVGRSYNSWLNWNVIIDFSSSATSGLNGIALGESAELGYIDHTVVQRIPGSALTITQPVDGGIYPDGRRFIFDWYVSFNLFEMRTPFPSTPVISVSTAGCTNNCTQYMVFAFNTIYCNATTSGVPALLSVDAGAGLAPEYYILNNVFYLTNAAPSSSIISFTNEQPSTYIVGNLYEFNSAVQFPLLRYGASIYANISNLRDASFETYANVSYGGAFPVSPEALNRLNNLEDPDGYYIDPYTGSEFEGGTYPNAAGDRINGVSVAVGPDNAPIDPVFLSPGHELRVTYTNSDFPAMILSYQFLSASSFVPVSLGPGLGISPEILVVSADYYLGAYDMQGRYIYDETRPGVIDSGCFRWLTALSISEDFSYDDGTYQYASLDVSDGVDLNVVNGGNVTVELVFDVPANSTVGVAFGGILLARQGNGTVEGVINVGQNGTFAYQGRLTLETGASVVIYNVRNCSFGQLLMNRNSSIVYTSSNQPFFIDRSGVFSGSLIINYTLPLPSIGRSGVVVEVAKFPAGSTSGSFQEVKVNPTTTLNKCTSVTGTPVQSSTSLAVLVQVQPTAGCDTTSPTGGSSISTGAIVGIVIGCAVGAILLIVAIILFARHRRKQKAAGASVALRKRTMENAERMKEDLKRQSVEMSPVKAAAQNAVPPRAAEDVRPASTDFDGVTEGEINL